MELTDYTPEVADQMVEELRAVFGNDALVKLMQARDARIYEKVGTDASQFMIDLQDKIHDIIVQATLGVAEQDKLDDEIIEERRMEPYGKMYTADEFLTLLEKRINDNTE